MRGVVHATAWQSIGMLLCLSSMWAMLILCLLLLKKKLNETMRWLSKYRSTMSIRFMFQLVYLCARRAVDSAHHLKVIWWRRIRWAGYIDHIRIYRSGAFFCCLSIFTVAIGFNGRLVTAIGLWFLFRRFLFLDEFCRCIFVGEKRRLIRIHVDESLYLISETLFCSNQICAIFGCGIRFFFICHSKRNTAAESDIRCTCFREWM